MKINVWFDQNSEGEIRCHALTGNITLLQASGRSKAEAIGLLILAGAMGFMDIDLDIVDVKNRLEAEISLAEDV